MEIFSFSGEKWVGKCSDRDGLVTVDLFRGCPPIKNGAWKEDKEGPHPAEKKDEGKEEGGKGER